MMSSKDFYTKGILYFLGGDAGVVKRDRLRKKKILKTPVSLVLT